MEIVLLIIAGAIVYYLYVSLQEYLKNPLNSRAQDLNTRQDGMEELQEEPQIESLQDRYLSTELGAMQAVILAIPDCKKEYLVVLARCMGQWYRSHYVGFDYKPQEEELLEKGAKADCEKLLSATYAEYKKRLNFIALMLVIMYLDGKLESEEREFLIDVAANLSLENEDFNALYDEFEAGFKEVGVDSAQSDVLQEKETLEEEKKMDQIFQENLIDIFDYKNTNKNFLESALKLYAEVKDKKIPLE